MSLATLPSDWGAWLRDGVARHCAPEDLHRLMCEGGIASAAARLALREAIAQRDAVDVDLLHGRRPSPMTTPGRFILDGRRIAVRCTLDQPQAVLYDDLLDDAECDALLALAEGRWARSNVVDSERGGERLDAHRTSEGAWFKRAETPLLAALERRIAALLGWPVENGEGLQVLRYRPGAEYRAHLDTFDPTRPGSDAHLARGGQRVGTLIVYLEEPVEGGGTRFAKAGVEVSPHRGSALYFACVDEFGAIDPHALHAGMPVGRGTKAVATKWLRQDAW